MTILEFESQLNDWGQSRTPFLFMTDFEMESAVAWRLDEIPEDLFFSINGFTNATSNQDAIAVKVQKYPMPFADYKSRFDFVKHRIEYGDSYLTNLTIKTKIDLNCTLEECFFQAKARYKVYLKNKFLFFSPETFIKITDGKIFSFPMKGTIDASLPDAEEIILKDIKELSEHVTIVDLIRNDLSRVATDVKVERFRYAEKIWTNQKNLLQVSSEIVGRLPDDFYARLGSILISLLPAGSISGAPKEKTIQIIQEAEREKRGYYTGVMGHFDGHNLDSGVMIRFIEYDDGQFFYRSGGGITSQSIDKNEYQEALDKIYVPVY